MQIVRTPLPAALQEVLRTVPHAGRPRPASLSCIVPCRNEARNLDLLLPRLTELLPRLADSWEVILVDDGSSDRTAMVMRDWSELPGFRTLELSRNFGKEAALTAGLQAARGDTVVMMDADLQHPPALIAEMVARWREGADVVYAQRVDRADESLLKRLGTHWFYRMLNCFDRVQVPEGAGDFRLLDRRAVDALLSLPERNRFMKGLYAWIGFDAVALPYVPAPRAHGHSQFSASRLLRLSFDGLTAFANWPLRVVAPLGMLLALASFAYGGYLVLGYLVNGHPVSGWTTIVVLLAFFFGAQMIFLGVIGEYLARVYEEVKGRPLYLVKRESGSGLRPRLTP
jgi:polyisoprenyl-phosphate glycosyltransferase